MTAITFWKSLFYEESQNTKTSKCKCSYVYNFKVKSNSFSSDKTKYRNCAKTSHAPFRCIATTLLLVTIRSVSKCNDVKVPINDKKVTSLLVRSSHQSSYFVTSKVPEHVLK